MIGEWMNECVFEIRARYKHPRYRWCIERCNICLPQHHILLQTLDKYIFIQTRHTDNTKNTKTDGNNNKAKIKSEREVYERKEKAPCASFEHKSNAKNEAPNRHLLQAINYQFTSSREMRNLHVTAVRRDANLSTADGAYTKRIQHTTSASHRKCIQNTQSQKTSFKWSTAASYGKRAQQQQQEEKKTLTNLECELKFMSVMSMCICGRSKYSWTRRTVSARQHSCASGSHAAIPKFELQIRLIRLIRPIRRIRQNVNNNGNSNNNNSIQKTKNAQKGKNIKKHKNNRSKSRRHRWYRMIAVDSRNRLN